MPDPPRSWRRWILALVLASYLTAALFASHYGYSVFLWDDSEYVAEALDTADHVTSFGLPSWLGYIAGAQHYSKPPLYVNTLALFIHLVGRERAPLAVGLLAAVSSALLGIAVFSALRRATSYWFAILSMLAIAGLPAVARWAPTAFPDLQLALCVVWVIAILLAEVNWFWLGLALGLGLLAKTTFPFFVLPPIAYWYWRGRYEWAARTRSLLKAGLVAAVIAAVWYPFNIGEALAYARHAAGGAQHTDLTFLETVGAWMRISAVQGTGLTMLVLIAAALIFLPTCRRETLRFPVDRVAMFLLGAVPFFLIALTSPWPNNRHPLPSFVLFALAFLVTIFWIAKTSRAGGALLALAIVGALGQWTLAKMAEIPWIAERVQFTGAGAKLAWLQPALAELQPASTDAVQEVLDRAEALGPAAPSRWYLSGNNGYFNVPRLQLAAKVRRIPVVFQWADYFDWTDEQIKSRLDSIANGSAILMVAHTGGKRERGDFLVPRGSWVQEHLSDFQILGHGNVVSIYATRTAYQAMAATLNPLFADYSGRAQISGLRIDGRTLLLRVKLLAPLACKYKLLLHAFGADDHMQSWDRKLDPPLCKWQPGDVRLLKFELPEAYLRQPYRLELGFFDEADREHGYPPLKLSGGGNTICVPSAETSDGNGARVTCPVGWPGSRASGFISLTY
jgi:4-amino-4-deoxy-L-arabinose transferase-like glycosyltransferase